MDPIAYLQHDHMGMRSYVLRIIEYSLDILWFISYLLCTLSSSFYVLFCSRFVPFFSIYTGFPISCSSHFSSVERHIIMPLPLSDSLIVGVFFM